jgi:NAD(P)-dependent dehydrogenase (short-subunit alcohol dehydrogenase family)
MAQPDLKTKAAIVTGTNREIGLAIVAGLAQAGFAVLAAHYGESERVQTMLKKLRDQGFQVESFEADLTLVENNQKLVARALELWGRLDVFVGNAGLTVHVPFLETTEGQWDTVVNLNLKASFFGAQAAAKAMLARDRVDGYRGRIIFSSSVTGVQALPKLAAYGITKAGVQHMAQTLGGELGRHGITVNALGIGATLNERNLQDNASYEADWAAVIPVGRVGTPEDVAQAVVWLTSSGAGMVNGHTLMIDGGWSAVGKVPE